jgi:hypothetical protein
VSPVDKVMATAEHEWRAYGVRRSDRAALAADLRLDLESAAADGIAPAQLLGTDVRGFARQLADEAGVERMPPEYLRLLGTMLVGAALGAVLGYVVLVFAGRPFVGLLQELGAVPIQLAVVVYYAIPAAVVVAGAVAAVRFHLRDLPRVRATAWAMMLLLPIAGAVITPVTMAFAWTTDYSTSAHVVLAEIVIVAAALAGATVLARRWSLREPAEAVTADAA